MFGNYFKIALRNLQKRKTYSWINITVLSAGLAVSIPLLFWVKDELDFDRFNVQAPKRFKLYAEYIHLNLLRLAIILRPPALTLYIPAIPGNRMEIYQIRTVKTGLSFTYS